MCDVVSFILISPCKSIKGILLIAGRKSREHEEIRRNAQAKTLAPTGKRFRGENGRGSETSTTEGRGNFDLTFSIFYAIILNIFIFYPHRKKHLPPLPKT